MEQGQILKVQNDIRANTTVTNNKDIIQQYGDISPIPIGGVKKVDTAISCSGKCFILWTSKTNKTILVPI